jgi:ankyrin repeat protein
LEHKFPINHVDSSYENVLHKAVRMKNYEAVKFLLDGKFKLNVDATNSKYETPLVLALKGINKGYAKEQTGTNFFNLQILISQEIGVKIIEYLITKGKATVQFTEKDLPTSSEKHQQNKKKKKTVSGNAAKANLLIIRI